MLQNESNKAVATFLTVVACMIFFLLLIGIVALAYGGDGVQTLLMGSAIVGGILLVLGAVIAIQLVGAYTSNLTVRNFIAAQQSNDDSDVAKFGALREIYRGQREENGHRAKLEMYDTQRVHKLAEQRSRILMASQPNEAEPVDSWSFDDDDVDAEYQVLE